MRDPAATIISVRGKFGGVCMPRFYFHVRDGVDCDDDEGLILTDCAAARAEALRGARSLMADQLGNGQLKLDGRIEVTDEAGRHVLTMPFREAVAIDG